MTQPHKDDVPEVDLGLLPPETASAEARDDLPLQPVLEALLLMADEPLATEALAEALRVSVARVQTELSRLADFYDRTGRGFQLRKVGGGWRYATRSEYYPWIADWVREGQQNRLTQAGLETLAVIAYLQPVSRARVSAVRGVNVDSAVRTLLAHGLIEEQGVDDRTGAGLLVTTGYFLERIGLSELADLPPIAPRLPDATELEAELARLTDPATDLSATTSSPLPAEPDAPEPKSAEPPAVDSGGRPTQAPSQSPSMDRTDDGS